MRRKETELVASSSAWLKRRGKGAASGSRPRGEQQSPVCCTGRQSPLHDLLRTAALGPLSSAE